MDHVTLAVSIGVMGQEENRWASGSDKFNQISWESGQISDQSAVAGSRRKRAKIIDTTKQETDAQDLIHWTWRRCHTSSSCLYISLLIASNRAVGMQVTSPAPRPTKAAISVTSSSWTATPTGVKSVNLIKKKGRPKKPQKEETSV